MGIWEDAAYAAGGIKGYLLSLFQKVIPFSSVLNIIRSALSDPDKKNRIESTIWKLLNDHPLGLFLKQIHFSSVLNIIREALSDPDNKNRIAVATWKLVDLCLEFVILRFTGGIPIYSILRDFLFSGGPSQ